MANITYRDYQIPLQANVPVQLQVKGDYYQVITANGSITLQFDQSVTISRQQSMGGPVAYKDSVIVTSPIDQTVVVSLGYTDGSAPYDGRGNFSAQTVNVTVQHANTLTPASDVVLAAGAATLIQSADATTIDTIIKNPATSVGAIRLGDSTVGATKGDVLDPGERALLTTTAAVYGYNPNASAVTVSVLRTRKV